MADSPAEAEATQALFCAIADYVGSDKIDSVLNLKTYPTYGNFKSKHSSLVNLSHNKLHTPSISLAKMETFLTDKKDWYESAVLTAHKIITSLSTIDKDFGRLEHPGWDNIFYVRGAKADKSRSANAMENIEALFKVANKNDQEFGDVNKWSPADIYFVSKDADKKIDEECGRLDKVKNVYDFGDLNKLVNGLLDSGDLLPLSLKKVKGEATLHNYNFSRSKEEQKLASIQYFGVSDWSKKYTIQKPITRDIKIYFSANQKEKIKIRHDPTSSNFGVNKAIKFEIEVSGAGGRGGSVVSWPIITKIISTVDKHLSRVLSSARDKAFINYEKEIIKLNTKYGVKKGDNKKELKNRPNGEVLYENYKSERVDLSGLFISNAIMPVLYDWFTANAKSKDTELINSKWLQRFVAYTSSRSPKSGKFVIAK